MKPVKGRAGRSIELHGQAGSVLGHSRLESTPPSTITAPASAESSALADTFSVAAAASLDATVYQELCMLPVYGSGGAHVQMNTWVVQGKYGGPVIRADDSSAIIDLASGVYALRIVPDTSAAASGSSSTTSP